MDNYQTFYFIFAAIVTLWLLSKYWVWALMLGTAALASTFAMIASVIHFNIGAAMGFALLLGALNGVHVLVSYMFDR